MFFQVPFKIAWHGSFLFLASYLNISSQRLFVIHFKPLLPMKKMLFMIALVVSVNTVFAQPSGKKNHEKKPAEHSRKISPDEKADKVSKRMKTDLSLSDKQAAEIKKITLARMDNAQTARHKAAEARKAYHQERKQIQQNWEQDLKGILSAQQYADYELQKEEQKKKMEERMKSDKKHRHHPSHKKSCGSPKSDG
jgi:protein CpxP